MVNRNIRYIRYIQSNIVKKSVTIIIIIIYSVLYYI